MEFLRDPVWQFVGAFLALVTIVITLILYWRQKQRKSISFSTKTFTSLLTVEEEIKGQIDVLFKGQPVKNLYVATIQIMNSGNIPVLANDFVRPISFTFGERANILSADIIETKPKNLGSKISNDGKAILLEPVLLNSKEWILIKILATEAKRPSIDGRIVGISKFNEIKYEGSRITGFMYILAFWTVAFVIYSANNFSEDIKKYSPTGIIQLYVFGIIFISFATYGFVALIRSLLRPYIIELKQIIKADS